MNLKLAIAALFLLASLIFVPHSFAGGQMVSLYADTNGSVNNNGLYGRVMRVFLHSEFPCKGTQITFKFVDPKDGDYIMTGSGNATYTLGERTNSGCATYAKMGSKVKGARQIEVDARNGSTRYTSYSMSVDFDGEYHGDTQIYRSSIEDPFGGSSSGNTSPTPTPQTLEIKPGLPGIKTRKLEKTTPENNPQVKKLDDSKPEKEESNSQELLKPSITPDKQVEELNQKVASLEGKLIESQKKQSVLEQTVNSLVSWIKNHIPFFK